MKSSKSGTIQKLNSSLKDEVQYSLPIGNECVKLNNLISKKIKISFNGDIFCIRCNNKIKKSFAQGYCFPCFRDSPETSECILRPELCRAHKGESRDMEWSKKMLKRVIFYPQKERRLQLSLQKDLRFFRLSCGSKQQGKKLSVDEPLYLEKGRRYLLDRLIK